MCSSKPITLGSLIADLRGSRAATYDTTAGTALRLGGIYGPGRTSLVEKVRAGDAECTPEPSWTNRIHRDDVYRWIAARLALPLPPTLYFTAITLSAELRSM